MSFNSKPAAPSKKRKYYEMQGLASVAETAKEEVPVKRLKTGSTNFIERNKLHLKQLAEKKRLAKEKQGTATTTVTSGLGTVTETLGRLFQMGTSKLQNVFSGNKNKENQLRPMAPPPRPNKTPDKQMFRFGQNKELNESFKDLQLNPVGKKPVSVQKPRLWNY